MLLELAQWLARDIRGFSVFNYITLRAVMATLTALAIGLLCGPVLIRKLAELKIGQSFVRNLDSTSGDAVIVRSTIEMSHNLGLKVVAEGVEFEPSLKLLKLWHCDTAQGYLISRPLSAMAFEMWMRRERVPL